MFKLFSILNKNLKITLRNWYFILFLVIGPLILIFLTGFTIEQSDISNIRIGMVAESHPEIDKILATISTETNLIRYNDIFRCIEDTKNENIAVCVKFSQLGINVSNFLLTVYYDGSKMGLTKIVTSYFKDKIGETEKEITSATISSLLANAAEFNIVMKNSYQFTEESKTQLSEIRSKLSSTKEQMSQLKQSFNSRYSMIKSLHVSETISILISAKSDLDKQVDKIDAASNSITSDLSKIRSTLPADQLALIDSNLNNILSALAQLKNAVAIYKSSSLDTATLNNIVDQYNQLLQFMDTVDSFFSSAIGEIDANIAKIDSTLIQLGAISKQINETSTKLSALSSIQPIAVLTPIIPLFKSLFTAISTVHLFFPTLLSLMMAFLGILLATIFILNETQSKGYIRNFITPTRDTLLIFSSFIIILLLVIFQAVVLLFISQYYFNLDVFSNIASLMIGIFFISTIFIELGMIIGYTFKTPHISILASTFLALALFLFSDIITPSEAMAPVISFAVRMNPLVFSESLFRKIFFMGMPIFSDTINLIKIGIFIVILTVGVYISYIINKKRI